MVIGYELWLICGYTINMINMCLTMIVNQTPVNYGEFSRGFSQLRMVDIEA